MGYLATPRHFALGGYETWAGANSLEPQASVRMLDTLLEMSASFQALAHWTKDHDEALNAFAEKRPPVFQDH